MKVKFRLLGQLLSVLWLWIAPAHAQADAISQVMQKFVEEHEVAGVVTLVASSRDVEHLQAVGKSDIATGRDMRTNDLFWIASMTKPMAAICVMMLVDEEKLSLDDPVEKHLPEFKSQWLIQSKDPKQMVLGRPKRAITLRDLLTHTSGIGDVKSPRPHSTLAELVMGYAREPLGFEPGSKWSYSNPGINTLGRLVEVVSGSSFADFIQQRLFNPLGMKDTTFWPSIEQIERVAKSYKLNKETHQLEETAVYFTDGKLEDRQRTPYPAGGLYSTAADVARVYQMMLSGGQYNGSRILKPESARMMTTTQSGDIKTGFVEGMSWGLGFQVVKEPAGVTGALSKGSFGHGGAYATQSWADPITGKVYILMIQRSGMPNGDGSAIREAFQNAAVRGR
jgi:CubicO group peptidase (beta-lactamase class C family)